MKEKIEKTFRCDYCNKLYLRRHACIEHEKRCSKNPDNFRACFDCVHLEYFKEDLTKDSIWDEHTFRVPVFYCRKKDVYVYPPKNEHKKNAYSASDLGDGQKENIPMKKECADFEAQQYLDYNIFRS